MRARAEQKDWTLSFSGEGPAVIHGDRRRLLQLLDNLISNGIKFTLGGGVVEIRVAQAGQDVSIEVLDTGIGIEPGEEELIFERFYRSPGAVGAQVPGTGLGLFIARAVVEAHGGRISAARRSGGGSVFRSSCRSASRRRPPSRSSSREPSRRARRRGRRGHPPPRRDPTEARRLRRRDGAHRGRGARARRASGDPSSPCSTSACPRPTESRSSSRSAQTSSCERCSFCCSPRRRRRRTCGADSRRAQTRTCGSRSRLPTCRPA